MGGHKLFQILRQIPTNLFQRLNRAKSLNIQVLIILSLILLIKLFPYFFKVIHQFIKQLRTHVPIFSIPQNFPLPLGIFLHLFRIHLYKLFLALLLILKLFFFFFHLIFLHVSWVQGRLFFLRFLGSRVEHKII